MKKIVIRKKEVEVGVEEIPEERLCRVELSVAIFKIDGEGDYISTRGNGELKGKSIFLSPDYDWTLGKDSLGEVCLVPLKKEGVEEDDI